MNVIVSVECFTTLMKENHNNGRTPFTKELDQTLQLTGTVSLFSLPEKGHWISWGPIADLMKLHSGSPPTHL